MPNKLILAVTILAAGFLVVQVIPVPLPKNLPVQAESAAQNSLVMPPAIHAVINRACANCHSYETKWPWYSRVAPASWLMSRDVERARHAMNLSAWDRRPAIELARLTAACADVQSSRMPPVQYRMMHPESRLTPEESATFCAWTRKETARIVQQRHHEPREIASK